MGAQALFLTAKGFVESILNGRPPSSDVVCDNEFVKLVLSKLVFFVSFEKLNGPKTKSDMLRGKPALVAMYTSLAAGMETQYDEPDLKRLGVFHIFLVAR